MLGRRYDSQVCSIARALEVVGERWSLLIIRDALFAGSTRYCDLQRSLGIATNVLKDRLDGFVEDGIMRRERYSDKPELFEYVLTDKGRGLAPTLIALTEWGDRWAAPAGPPVRYRHIRCGSTVGLDVVCETCGRLDDVAEENVQPGPGMPADHIAMMQQRIAARRARPTSA